MRASPVVLGLALLLGPLAAHAAAGQVLFALGTVEIKRAGQTVAVARGTAVEVGDTVSTGPTGMTQLRMKDGSLLALRYGSSMVVEEFRLPEQPPATAAPAASGPPRAATGGRSVLRLLRGAFRTVTGLIGKGAGDTYRVVTPVATIGIRGTDYSAAYCSGDCGKTPDGLYLGVSNGEIEVNNGGGALVLTNDQYGYVRDPTTPPNRELAPPEALETPIAPEEGEGSDDESGEGATDGASAEGAPDASFSEESGTERAIESGSDQPEGDYELRPGSPGRFAFARVGANDSGNNGVYTDDRGGLAGFLTDGFTSIGTAQNVNFGSDQDTGLRWGRWTGGTASVSGSDLDLTTASLHWIYSGSSGGVLPISGTLNYTLVGNTDPTTDAGGVGFLGSATFQADFTNGTVFSTLDIGFGDSGTAGSQVWNASGSGTLGADALFGGGYGVSVTTFDGAGGSSAGSGTGTFAGFFTDNAAGAGMTYTLDDGSSTVSGAAAFGNPQSGAPAGVPQ